MNKQIYTKKNEKEKNDMHFQSFPLNIKYCVHVEDALKSFKSKMPKTIRRSLGKRIMC